MNEQQTTFHKSINIEFNKQRRMGFGFWFGLILVFVGGGLLLDAFDVIEFSDLLWMWWPSLLMLIAIGQLITGSGTLIGTGILFTIGALLQLSKLDYLPGGFWTAFWPIVLILIGVSMVSSRWKKKQSFSGTSNVGTMNVEGSRIDRSAFFTGIDTRMASKDFSGGELTAVFGAIEVDFRDCEIASNAAHLKLTSIFGGIELRVPPTWRIVIKGTPIFGGIEDKSSPHPLGTEAPTLILDTTAIFGGIEIH